jgi:phospholipid/cholesterol/gamma-HCH transport system permease protein
MPHSARPAQRPQPLPPHRPSLLARAYRALARRGQAMLAWARSWWALLFIAAQVIVLAFSPSSYNAGSNRRVVHQLYLATAPGLRSFTLLMALFNVVIIRIMVSIASSYGLSGYALTAAVRTLVLELIPLTAALFVAIQYSVPSGNELFKTRRARLAGGAGPQVRPSASQQMSARHMLGTEVLPRVLAGVFAVVFLGLLSSLISLAAAYLIVYGPNHWGLQPYTRAVGQIFNPATSLIFLLKSWLFALVVAVLPVGVAMQDWPQGSTRTSVELQGLVRMLALLLVIEAVSLIGNYY